MQKWVELFILACLGIIIPDYNIYFFDTTVNSNLVQGTVHCTTLSHSISHLSKTLIVIKGIKVINITDIQLDKNGFIFESQLTFSLSNPSLIMSFSTDLKNTKTMHIMATDIGVFNKQENSEAENA